MGPVGDFLEIGAPFFGERGYFQGIPLRGPGF